MKKFLEALMNLFSKPLHEKLKEKHGDKLHICHFGMKEFNKIKRSADDPQFAPGGIKGKPRKTTTTTSSTTLDPNVSTSSSTTLPPSTGSAVLFLDFDGYTVRNTAWNYNQTEIVCAPARMTQSEQDAVLANVASDYSPFNITVTADEAVYNAANRMTRTRVVVTESWEWFGQAGGVAFLDSFTWGDDTPCFVFTSLLAYNVKYVSEAASHEGGHTMGLKHQSTYDASCKKTAEYNPGCCGEAPIMGVSYYQADGRWWDGPTSDCCTCRQIDFDVLKALLGLR